MSRGLLPDEKWLPVVGYEGLYEVSNIGRVRSLGRFVISRHGTTRYYRHGKIRAPFTAKNGYIRVTLIKDGVDKKHSIHTLVISAFIGSKPTSAHQTRHKNGVRCDNVYTNLEWGTSSENNLDRVRHGTMPLGESHPHAMITVDTARQIKRRLSDGDRICDVAKTFDVSRAIVVGIRLGKTWAHVS